MLYPCVDDDDDDDLTVVFGWMVQYSAATSVILEEYVKYKTVMTPPPTV